ncbi:N-acetylmuramoyl-L-alanine amidase_gp065 [Bacillus phage vB_BceM_WH1]|nr:N-acetylmuramoyl-L-alanine amidase_gp065 [Bacillus phage vB_BceM_WH1]
MATYNVHGGHNGIVMGANSQFGKEHILDRQVKDALISKLRALGHTVYDCTDEVGATQSANLRNIVAKCNAHKVDLDISLHLNAFNGTANGVEVCYYDQQALAAKVSKQLSDDIGWSNRGAKPRTDLYVLNNTAAPAILIELGFIDNAGDMGKWNTDKIANSIVKALTGQTVGGGSTGGSTGGGGTVAPPSDGRYGTLTVTGDVVNIRKGPGTNYDIAPGTGYQGDGKARQGETYIVWAEQNGWYNVGGDAWIIKDFVDFIPAPQANEVGKLVVALVDGLYTYNSANWNDKGKQINKGTALTITEVLTVDGYKMYKTKSGIYITAAKEYVVVK